MTNADLAQQKLDDLKVEQLLAKPTLDMKATRLGTRGAHR